MASALPNTTVYSRSDLAGALEPIAVAATRGQYELLLAEAERAVARLFPSVQPRVLVRTGGAWHEWSTLEHGVETGIDTPAGMEAWDAARRVGTSLFVPVVTGALGLWISGNIVALETSSSLPILRQFLALALQTCERQRIATQNLDEVQALQRVATRMLKSHDLGEILLLITQEAKRLLSADICGVLLREQDRIVMRRCVGHRSPETANLQMSPGQGLAGLVLEQGEPAAVEDYLASQHISRDFFRLAEAEMVRSALAAPLVGREAIIGVLEVWRRRPSTFTAQDTMRLVALANLTSIAIENAELYAQQTRMVEELGLANTALNQRYDMVRSVANLAQSLMQMLLQGAGLPAIVASAAAFLKSEVGVVDSNGALLAGDTEASQAHAASGRLLAKRSARAQATHADGVTVKVHDARWRAQPVMVEGDTVAWALGKIVRKEDDLTELTLTQVAMFAALQRLEQRAASRARSETIDATVWDLLRADDAARDAAIDRAADINLELDGPLRLYVCELGPTAPGSTERGGSALRQQVTRSLALAKTDVVRAAAMQGTSIAIVCSDQPLDDCERFAQRLATQLAEVLEGRCVILGASGQCASARALSVAYREAQIALDVARQLGRTGAIVYDRAGVVGILLSLRHEVGMRRFLDLNLGKLLREEEKKRDVLLQTLRVFFDVNCSHEAASQRLGVHRKTIAHRLAKISELSGLDLTTHDDRLVADLSLYVYQMLLDGSKSPANLAS